MNHSEKELSASALMDFEVVNIGGENLGHIDDVMIDLANGRVPYAGLSLGGFWGLGDKLFAIPWSKVEPHPQKDKMFILDVPKEMLDKARGFDKNNWPDVSDPQWRQEMYGYYGAKPYWDYILGPGAPGDLVSSGVPASGKEY